MEEWQIALISVGVGFLFNVLLELLRETKHKERVSSTIKEELNKIKNNSHVDAVTIIENRSKILQNADDLAVPEPIETATLKQIYNTEILNISYEHRESMNYIFKKCESLNSSVQELKILAFEDTRDSQKNSRINLICDLLVAYYSHIDIYSKEGFSKKLLEEYGKYTEDELKNNFIESLNKGK